MISEDKIYFEEEWINPQCFKNNNIVNIRYVIRFIVRLMDVTLRVLFVLLVWIYFGGLYSVTFIIFELIMILVLAFHSNRYEI